jgi:hypothetical protein
MYKLGPGVTVDVFAVGELVDRAEREVTSNSARAFAAARQALQLLGSGRTLVKARDAPWTVSVRALPLSLARRACLTLASAALQLGDPTTARTAVTAAASNRGSQDHCSVGRPSDDGLSTGDARRSRSRRTPDSRRSSEPSLHALHRLARRPDLTPARVPGLSDVAAVSAGDCHAFAVPSHGRGACEGCNTGTSPLTLDDRPRHTRTDPGTRLRRHHRDRVEPLPGSAGGRHGTCLGGRTRTARSGDGTTTTRLTPAAVPELSSVTVGRFLSQHRPKLWWAGVGTGQQTQRPTRGRHHDHLHIANPDPMPRRRDRHLHRPPPCHRHPNLHVSSAAWPGHFLPRVSYVVRGRSRRHTTSHAGVSAVG